MKKYLYILILGFIALLNATYLSYKAYYFKFIDPMGLSSFCDFSATASCTEVLRHPLSNVFSIPFPWIAMVVYPIILALAYFGYKNKTLKHAKIIQVLSFMGILFNGFIIYREAMYIHAYCVLCLMCTAIIISIFTISTIMLRKAK